MFTMSIIWKCVKTYYDQFSGMNSHLDLITSKGFDPLPYNHWGLTSLLMSFLSVTPKSSEESPLNCRQKTSSPSTKLVHLPIPILDTLHKEKTSSLVNIDNPINIGSRTMSDCLSMQNTVAPGRIGIPLIPKDYVESVSTHPTLTYIYIYIL